MRTAFLAVLLVLTSICARGDRLVVTRVWDSGHGSLRGAIEMANSNPANDRIVFAPGLSGREIAPKTPLPKLWDDGTWIDGDINNDGAPDIGLSGRNVAVSADGLTVRGDNCTIEGLAITHWDGYGDCGLYLKRVTGCRVQCCHIGVNLAGTAAVYNYKDVFLRQAHNNTIGGRGRGNIICGGQSDDRYYGLDIIDSSSNLVSQNYFGTNRAGDAILGEGSFGVYLLALEAATRLNVVRENLFAGLHTGIAVQDASSNVMVGNTFGLAANGRSHLRMWDTCIGLFSGSNGNRIGGTADWARNVFAGNADTGIRIGPGSCANNRILGNYFGTNAAGTAERRLQTGIKLHRGVGAQTIGGATAAHRNYFASSSRDPWRGIVMDKGGDDTVIQNNHFGNLPSGAPASCAEVAISIDSERARILDNCITGAADGISVEGCEPGDAVHIYGNLIRSCSVGVRILDDSVVRLGNLGNASTADDGGNRFRRSNTWHIRNEGGTRTRAEGNGFATTVQAEIEAKIYDRLDDPALGRVDFIPLSGGVMPTGDAGTVGRFFVTGASATPTATGAQITFTLSSPGHVQARVLNIAGRPVKTLCHARGCEAGGNTLLWNAQSENGLRVPNGTYLVEVSAKAADGTQARALAQVRISR